MINWRQKYRIGIRIIAMAILCLFAFNSVSWSLAPEIRLTKEEFAENYFLNYSLLAHAAVNEYVKEQILSHNGIENLRGKRRDEIKMQTRRDQIKIQANGQTIEQELLIAAIPGLLKNTGQFAHVGLGRANGKPVIYVDSAYFYNEKVIAHEKSEIAQWETFRRKKKYTYQQMRAWIKNNPEQSKKMAEKFHDNSEDLSALYKEIQLAPEKFIDLDSMYLAYLNQIRQMRPGLDKDDTDVNIAAVGWKSLKGKQNDPENTYSIEQAFEEFESVERILRKEDCPLDWGKVPTTKQLMELREQIVKFRQERSNVEFGLYYRPLKKKWFLQAGERGRVKFPACLIKDIKEDPNIASNTAIEVHFHPDEDICVAPKDVELAENAKSYIDFLRLFEPPFTPAIRSYIMVVSSDFSEWERRLPLTPQFDGFYEYTGEGQLGKFGEYLIPWEKFSTHLKGALRILTRIEMDKGTPAQLLYSIIADEELFRKTLREGITAEELADGRLYRKKAVKSGLKLLESLGVLKSVKNKPIRYSFSEMMRSVYPSHTQRFVNTLISLKYKVRGKIQRRPLDCFNIPKSDIGRVKQRIETAVLEQKRYVQQKTSDRTTERRAEENTLTVEEYPEIVSITEDLQSMSRMFQAYETMLSPYGQETMRSVAGVLNNLQKQMLSGKIKKQSVKKAKKLISLMPDPQHIDVEKNGKRNWLNWFIEEMPDSRESKIGSGCLFPCYFCRFYNKEPKTKSDPLPTVVRKILSGQIYRVDAFVRPWSNSDCFDWYDPFFGVGLDGILELALRNREKAKLNILTRGWDLEDKFMQKCAENIVRICSSGQHEFGLSFHLFGERYGIIDKLKKDATLDDLESVIENSAIWYANVLRTLSPVLDEIIIYTTNEHNPMYHTITKATNEAFRRAWEEAELSSDDLSFLESRLHDYDEKDRRLSRGTSFYLPHSGISVVYRDIMPEGNGAKLNDVFNGISADFAGEEDNETAEYIERLSKAYHTRNEIDINGNIKVLSSQDEVLFEGHMDDPALRINIIEKNRQEPGKDIIWNSLTYAQEDFPLAAQGTFIQKEKFKLKNEKIIYSWSGETLEYWRKRHSNRIDHKNKIIKLGEGAVIATNSGYRLSTGRDYLSGCSLIIIQMFVEGAPYAYAAIHRSSTAEVCDIEDFLKKHAEVPVKNVKEFFADHSFQRAINFLSRFEPSNCTVEYKAMLIKINKRNLEQTEKNGLEKIWKIPVDKNAFYSYGSESDRTVVEYDGSSAARVQELKWSSGKQLYIVQTIGNLTWTEPEETILQPLLMGSPAACLEVIKQNTSLFQKAFDKENGITPADIHKNRPKNKKTNKPYHPDTTYGEFRILTDLGIFTKIRKGHYRFSDMMTGPDENYTKTLINAICDITYQVGQKGNSKPLQRGDIPKEQGTTVKELVKMAILNQINLMQHPVIPEQKVLWHILEQDVLSESQKSFLTRLNKISLNTDSPERIWVVRRGETIEQAIETIKENCSNAIFDVALSSTEHIEKVPDLGVEDKIKMLVFQGEAGDFSQVVGIIAALRALHFEKTQIIPSLLNIYKAIKGAAYDGELPSLSLLNNPKQFARNFIITVPPVSSLPIDEIPRLNSFLMNILEAA